MDIKKSDTSKKQDSIKNREKINKIVEEETQNLDSENEDSTTDLDENEDIDNKEEDKKEKTMSKTDKAQAKVIENLVTLFQSLNNIHQDYQLELYLALAVMIKYHFRGNNDKIKEMLTMITEVMQEEVVDELPTEDKKTLEIIELNGKVTELNGTVNELHGEVNELNGEVNELNGKLSEKDKIIKELRQEIEQYKNK